MFLDKPRVTDNQKSRKRAILNHVKMLTVFFILHVALLSADIFTDVLSAHEFFERGDHFWGIFTLIPVFAPFIARVIIIVENLRRCFVVEFGKLLGLKIPGTVCEMRRVLQSQASVQIEA